MASKAAQKGLKYEPVENIPDGGAERRGCNFWTSLSPDFSWAHDFLHSRLAQIGRLDCLSPERHALEIGRGSCGNAFSAPQQNLWVKLALPVSGRASPLRGGDRRRRGLEAQSPSPPLARPLTESWSASGGEW